MMIRISLMLLRNYKPNLFQIFKKSVCILMMMKLLLFIILRLMLLFKIKLLFLKERLLKHQLLILLLNIWNIFLRLSYKESKILLHLLINKSQRMIKNKKFKILIPLIKIKTNNLLVYLFIIILNGFMV